MPQSTCRNSETAKIVPCTGKFVAAGREKSTEKTDRKFEFTGRHFIANYFGCEHSAICNTTGLIDAMKEGAEASGATIIKLIEHTFSPSGFTALLLLSESHASIHTYPERNACFVDLFTCGQSCIAEKFHMVLLKYLQPAGFSKKILIRGNTIQEDFLKT